MTTSIFSDGVLYSPRAPLVNLLRNELKKLGVESAKTHVPSTPEECKTKLKSVDKPILVLDWTVGVRKALVVLQAIRGEHEIDTTPTLLIVNEFDQNILGAAAEFGVAEKSSAAMKTSADSIGVEPVPGAAEGRGEHPVWLGA